MSETPLPNDPASRAPDGTLKDQATTTSPPPPPAGTSTLTDQTAALSPAELAAAEAKKAPKAADGDKSLLNDKDAKVTGAPEKYEEFKVPEGFTLDPEIAKEAGELFKGLNLSQEGGQKLIDFYTAKTQEAAEAPYKAYTDMRKEWRDQVAASDLGPKLAEVKTTVSRALDSLGDPKLATEFREAMDLTGAGDHPAFIRVINKLAQMVTEGKPVAGQNPSPHGQGRQGAQPSPAQALYPNLS